MKALVEIQRELKAPKGQYNSFGKYHYRSCEDIIEAVKPLLHERGFALQMDDEPVEIGGRVYIKATASIFNGEHVFTSTAYAREEETKKGMDGSQITGAASSYARKYALNGLFAIDDSKDADNKKAEVKKESFPNDPDKWNKAIQFVAGGGNIESIIEKYDLTKEQEDELRKHIS